MSRHNLPFYYIKEMNIQISFLNTFLNGNDHASWTTGYKPRVSLCLRKGDIGFNDPAGKKTFPCRNENEWPLARTVYTRYYLTSSLGLTQKLTAFAASQLGYQAGGSDIGRLSCSSKRHRASERWR